MQNRKIFLKYAPESKDGFLGEGHKAAMLFEGLDFKQTDPFIVLADDRINLSGAVPAGGAHPHAGFEIAMFIIEGAYPEDERMLKAGDMEILTTGSGVVHTETFNEPVKTRILQLWMTLPKKDRKTEPREQRLHVDSIPVLKEEKNEIRIYSGSSRGLTAPTQNRVPVTIVDFHLESGYETIQVIPTTYNAFMYVVSGAVAIGDESEQVTSGHVAWFSIPDEGGESQIKFKGMEDGTRVVFYAGEPQHDEIVPYGPFVADSKDDIPELYRRFRSGDMPHVKNFKPHQIITY